ncbi:NmrA family NAD(P)-binding protein [Streptomyces sp. NPDC059215]|uniref:NmrA family NAD(P)-binding protein n=1 Tax=Streptomyces sp. NPDC059215 TaxID=3346772 RepID=UPI003691281C
MSSKDGQLFLITGATGHTGAKTVHLLLERGHRVRAFVHREDVRSQALAAAGAEIAVGDLLDFQAVSAAMRGVTNAYFCYPIEPGLVEATVIFAQAAVEANVKSVVNMSQISARREAQSDAARHHWLAERLLDRTNLITTHLRPTFFAEWIEWYFARDEDKGTLRLPMGDARHAPIVGEDQGYVIAAVLENPEAHDRQIYFLHGPKELDHHGIAEEVSRALDIPVTYEPITIDEYTQSLETEVGFPPHLVQHLRNVVIDYHDGVFAGTNNLIEAIGNRTPMTVEEYVRSRKEAFAQTGPYAIAPKPR